MHTRNPREKRKEKKTEREDIIAAKYTCLELERVAQKAPAHLLLYIKQLTSQKEPHEKGKAEPGCTIRPRRASCNRITILRRAEIFPLEKSIFRELQGEIPTLEFQLLYKHG